MIKFIDLLASSGGAHSYAKLCNCFNCCIPWIANELRAELKYERNQLKIPEHISYESRILIMKVFGNSKRLSEVEKKELQRLVAGRTECMREAWNSQLQMTENALKFQLDVQKQQQAEVENVIQKLTSFLVIKQPSNAKSMSSVETQLGDTTGSQTNQLLLLLDGLFVQIDELQSMTANALNERDKLQNEKVNALRIIDINDKVARIDIEIDKLISRNKKDLQSLYTAAERRDEQIESLNREYNATKATLGAKIHKNETQIKQLEEELSKRHTEINEMKATIDGLNESLFHTRQDLQKTSRRSSILEKSRHLGFVQEKEVVSRWMAAAAATRFKEKKSPDFQGGSDKWKAAVALSKLSPNTPKLNRPKTSRKLSQHPSKKSSSF